MCYTVTDEVKDSVSHGKLDYCLFCKIVHQLAAHSVYSIRLSWRGDPTLNRHFV